MQPVGTKLAYQAALAPGEVRQLVGQDGSVMLSIGNRSFGQTLARQSGNLIVIAPFTLLLMFTGFALVRSYLPFYGLGYLFSSSRGRWRLSSPLILMILLSWEVRKLVRVLRRVRETTVVVASAQGLRFTNAPGFPESGSIARSDIESLVVIPQAGVGLRPSYRVDARRYASAKRQARLLAHD